MEANISLIPRQMECWKYLDPRQDNTTRFIFYGGGAGGGKSYLGCLWLLSMCLAYPDTHWFMGRANLTDLRNTTLETLWKCCKDLGISSDLYKYNAQFNYILFNNSSKIFLLALKYNPSDPDFQSIGSTEYTGGFIDEIGDNITKKAYETLKSRCGRWNNEKYGITPKMFCSCNPSKNWIYTEMYMKWKNNELPENTKFVRSLYTDNPFVAKSYGEQLSSINNVAQKERLMYGNWEYDEDDTKLVEYDAILDLFDNTVENGAKYITCDVARFGSDTTTIAVWDGMELKDLIIHNGESTATTAQRIRDLTKIHKIPYGNVVIDENGIGGGVIDQLRGTIGFVNNSKPFSIKNKSLNNDKREMKENFASLKDQCYFHLAEYIRDHKIRLDIKRDFREHVIQELDACLRMDSISDDKRQRIIKKDRVKEIINRSPDVADCIMMRMYFELKETRRPHGVIYRQFNPRFDNLSF